MTVHSSRTKQRIYKCEPHGLTTLQSPIKWKSSYTPVLAGKCNSLYGFFRCISTWSWVCVLGFCGKISVVRCVSRVSSVRNTQELPRVEHSWLQNSKIVSPFVKGEFTREVGGTSMITYLRKDKKHCTPAVRKCERNILQTPRSVKKEGEVVLQALQHRFPLSPWRGPWWCRLPPQRTVVQHVIPAAHGEPAHAGTGFSQELWPRVKSPHWSRFFWQEVCLVHAEAVCAWRTAPHVKDLCWSSSLRTAAHGKDPHWRVWRMCFQT